MTVFTQLWKAFSNLPEVTAIALGGSRSGETYDETSDYDLYVYCMSIPDEDSRKLILTQYCSYMEISNQFWELEDDCTLNNGIDIDILYRNIRDFAIDIENVVEKCRAGNGYTTCFWHNLKTCKVLYDANGELGKLKKRFYFMDSQCALVHLFSGGAEQNITAPICISNTDRNVVVPNNVHDFSFDLAFLSQSTYGVL